MKPLDDTIIYSIDLVDFNDRIDFKKETVYRVRYRFDKETYTMLFNSDSDAREYVDAFYPSWRRNHYRNQPPDPQADSDI
jgi:hypothetical protein